MMIWVEIALDNFSLVHRFGSWPHMTRGTDLMQSANQYKYTSKQIHKYTMPQIYNAINIQCHKYTMPQIHKDKNTKKHKYTKISIMICGFYCWGMSECLIYNINVCFELNSQCNEMCKCLLAQHLHDELIQ